ncbi:MAG: DUF3995 domain-containing protein [Actinomycetota bacterium]
MTVAQILAAGGLALLAAAHSALGETDVLRPLFAAEWAQPQPRWAHERILRFAWHLTSIAWLGLAAIVLEVDPLLVIAVVALMSGAVIFFALRGHLAWPIFLLAGLAALHAHTPLPDAVLVGGAIATVAALASAAALHLWWAAGGRWGIEAALPTDPELEADEQFRPGALLTLSVAILLAAGALIVAAVVNGGGSIWRLPAIVMGVAFALRAVGDTRIAGFTKTVRDTDFARNDDRLFTPLCVALALGTWGALLV